MCLAVLAIGMHPRWPWVLASNRDEYFDRAAAPLGWWRPAPDAAPLLGGRDLSAGGTWLALNASGRLALVTNVREPQPPLADAPSRGELVTQWLGSGPVDPLALAAVPRNGFNLLAAELAADPEAGRPVAAWLTNRPARHRALDVGVHGLSNAALGTPWPKVQRLGARVANAIGRAASAAGLVEALMQALRDDVPAADSALPSTGVPLEIERALSPAFIRFQSATRGLYGTRCSTVVLAEGGPGARTLRVVERGFGESGQVGAEHTEVFAPFG